MLVTVQIEDRILKTENPELIGYEVLDQQKKQQKIKDRVNISKNQRHYV